MCFLLARVDYLEIFRKIYFEKKNLNHKKKRARHICVCHSVSPCEQPCPCHSRWRWWGATSRPAPAKPFSGCWRHSCGNTESQSRQGIRRERRHEDKDIGGDATVPLHDLFADGRGAGEAQLADVRVVGQTLSHHAACRGRQVMRQFAFGRQRFAGAES